MRSCTKYLLGASAATTLSLFAPQTGWATLYVIVFDKTEIAIASDSRHLVFEGKTVKVLDGFQKVTALGTYVAFMSSGMTELSTNATEIRPTQIARQCYEEPVKRGRRISLSELSRCYGDLMTECLNRASQANRAQVQALMERFEPHEHQLLESIITGIDSDGAPKVETTDLKLTTPSPASPDVLAFAYTLDEAVAGESTRVILSGEVGVLRDAFQYGNNRVAALPSVRAWSQAMQQGKRVDSAQTAEALLNLAIEYSPQDQTRLGYPVFVYQIDARGGLRRIRVVPRGRAVDLPH